MHESEKWKWSRSVVSDSQWPRVLQPTRLLCPWDFPGKSTGVGCHCLLLYWTLGEPYSLIPSPWLIRCLIHQCFLPLLYGISLEGLRTHAKTSLTRVSYSCYSCLVTKSCLILCDPMDYSLPGSSIHGISQARILEWVVISSSRDLPDPGI